jgi:RecA/RadA recombinase
MPKKASKATEKALSILERGSTEPTRSEEYLSLGCPLLNLAVSGDWRKGLLKGTYMFYAGDSSSGKTLATLTQLAEAANDPKFDEYELWHIDAEVGNFFDFEVFFGKKAANRIQILRPKDGEPMLLEFVYDWIEAKIDAGIKLVVVVDSFDSLSSEQKEKKISEDAKLRAEGKEVTGKFTDGKPKVNSERLSRIMSKLAKNGSIMTGICQIRDNMNAGLYGPKHNRGGGHAIKFNASVEIWTVPGEKMKKKVNDKDRIVGYYTRFNIKKNRVNGRERSVTIPIIPDVGMDATGAAVDFLVDEKVWTESSGNIASSLYEATYKREALIRKIEDDGREQELYEAMQAAWDGVEEKLKIQRKKRYE